MTTEERERLTSIGKVLRDAMGERKAMDWTKDTAATKKAQAALDDRVSCFVEGGATRTDVREAYQFFAKAHEVKP